MEPCQLESENCTKQTEITKNDAIVKFQLIYNNTNAYYNTEYKIAIKK